MGAVLFLLEQKGGATAKLTPKLKQIQEDTAEAKEQVTNSHSANFRDEVTQIVSDVKVISATLSKPSMPASNPSTGEPSPNTPRSGTPYANTTPRLLPLI